MELYLQSTVCLHGVALRIGTTLPLPTRVDGDFAALGNYFDVLSLVRCRRKSFVLALNGNTKV
jgi:hypothetical protein